MNMRRHSLPPLVYLEQLILPISRTRYAYTFGYVCFSWIFFLPLWQDDYLTGLVNSGSSAILTRSSNPSDTAIWSYDATSGSVTGLWIQSSGGPVPLHIWYDNPAHTFYLTESADPPTQKSKPVVCITLLVTALNRWRYSFIDIPLCYSLSNVLLCPIFSCM